MSEQPEKKKTPKVNGYKTLDWVSELRDWVLIPKKYQSFEEWQKNKSIDNWNERCWRFRCKLLMRTGSWVGRYFEEKYGKEVVQFT